MSMHEQRQKFEAWCATEMGVVADDIIGAEGLDLWACWQAASEASLSMRDQFAITAIPAMLAHYSANGSESICQQYAEIAGEAYRVADAMLASRDA